MLALTSDNEQAVKTSGNVTVKVEPITPVTLSLDVPDESQVSKFALVNAVSPSGLAEALGAVSTPPRISAGSRSIALR